MILDQPKTAAAQMIASLVTSMPEQPKDCGKQGTGHPGTEFHRSGPQLPPELGRQLTGINGKTAGLVTLVKR